MADLHGPHIEVLLQKAHVDAAFRALLLESRDAAASAIGLELSPPEAEMLRSLDRAQLEAVIDAARPSPDAVETLTGDDGVAMLPIATRAYPIPGPVKGIRPGLLPVGGNLAGCALLLGILAIAAAAVYLLVW